MSGGVLVDVLEHRDQLGAELVGLGDVPLQQRRGNVEALALEVGEEVVVDARGFEEFQQHRVGLGVGFEHRQHLAVLVAEQEFDRAVLAGLEPGGVAQEAAELRVLGGCQGGQHGPLLGQGLLDVLDPGDRLQRRAEVVGAEPGGGAAELVQDQLEPQLRGLVLDDEQHLVVVLRSADRLLGAEQRRQLQVGRVAHPGAEVPDNVLVQLPRVLLNGHSLAFLAKWL